MNTVHMRRKRNNPRKRIDSNFGSTISMALKGKKAGRPWESIVGYTLDDLILHLESKFQDGMSLNNYGRNGWHIDHIKPRSLFSYTDVNDVEFKQCWALENLQPLWEHENISKGNKY
jgi:5-methylcytosine-specific restriction endonuclease McrA